jgi:hypothetical protein
MSCKNLERVECMGNWLREGLPVSRRHDGKDMIDVNETAESLTERLTFDVEEDLEAGRDHESLYEN